MIKPEVKRYAVYKTMQGFIGMALLWFFIDFITIPWSNTITRGLLWIVWSIVNFWVYSTKVFVRPECA
jgi:hypothetical protein